MSSRQIQKMQIYSSSLLLFEIFLTKKTADLEVNTMDNKQSGITSTGCVGCLGMLGGFSCMIVGFVWSVQIIVAQWGVPMGMLSVVLFPVTLAAMPWYCGFVLGKWSILGLLWGGGLISNVSNEIFKG